MPHVTRTPVKVAAILAFGALLAGCNNSANDGVRGGPQAVHPSPSALAQGTTVTTTVAAPASTCGGEGQHACYTPRAGDGSQPIID